MTTVRRTDLLDMGSNALTPALKAMLAPPRKTKDGFLIVEGFASRTGIQEYRRADGRTVKEYRPPEEVHAPASLATYEGNPVTDNHPAVFVTPATSRALSRGSMLSVTPLPDHGLNKVKVSITDSEAITQVEAGKRQLSLGYLVTVVDAPGVTPDGQRYDAVQRNIITNHLAIVDRARAGDVAQLRLDAAGDLDLGLTNPPQETTMDKVEITIGGRKVLVAQDHAQAIMDAVGASEGAIKGAHADAIATKDTEIATLSGENKVLKADAAKPKTDAAEIQSRVDARLALMTEASPLLPDDYKADGKTEAQVKLDAVKHAMDLDVTEAEAPGAYKMVLSRYKGSKPAQDAALGATSGGDAPKTKTDATTARADFLGGHEWDHDKGRNKFAVTGE